MTGAVLKGYRRPSLWTWLLRIFGWLIALVILVVGAYALTALALGAIPVNSSFVESPGGVSIYVRTNGVHAELILPTREAGVDWSIAHPPSDMRAVSKPLNWVAFGWGDRGFFASTPTWSDLHIATALSALSGTGPGAMHVEYVNSPLSYKTQEIKVSRDQYLRLAAHIRSSFARDAAGQPLRANVPGYFAYDAFYEASLRYRPWFTCNDWVRSALTEAGVRAPMWSPFDIALFYQLRRIKH